MLKNSFSMLMDIIGNFDYVDGTSKAWIENMILNPIDGETKFKVSYYEFIKIVVSELDDNIKKIISELDDDILIHFHFKNKKLISDSIEKFDIKNHTYEMTDEMKKHFVEINKMAVADFKKLEYHIYKFVFDSYDNIEEYKEGRLK